MRRRGLVGLLAVVLCASGGALGEPEKPSIGEAMRRMNGGANSLRRNLELDLKESDPDWDAIQESTAEYLQLARVLEKGKPPLGGAASWDRLSKAYIASARALDAAARKKDRGTASAALGRINNSCKTCHQVHRKTE